MKLFVWSAAAAASAVILSGCSPELAQIEPGSEERNWQQAIEKDYPGYKPPRMAPPAIKDNTQGKKNGEAAVEAIPAAPAADAPAIDPMAAVDQAADRKDAAEAKPAEVKKADAKETAAPAIEVKPVDAQKADAKSADEPAAKIAGEVYEVKPGDSLGKIAKKFYGDARCYDLIVKANKISDPNKVRPGTKLVIPQL